jgi:hypothetical protein
MRAKFEENRLRKLEDIGEAWKNNPKRLQLWEDLPCLAEALEFCARKYPKRDKRYWPGDDINGE